MIKGRMAFNFLQDLTNQLFDLLYLAFTLLDRLEGLVICSLILYFVIVQEIPLKVIAQSRLMDFVLEDVTKYVKDAKPYYRYYICTPYVLSNTDEYEAFSEELPFGGYIYEYQYFSWCIQEFYKLGSFKFINVWEDNTKCDPGYHEDFFGRCDNIEIDFSNFKQNFESKDRFNKFERISEDILYIVN